MFRCQNDQCSPAVSIVHSDTCIYPGLHCCASSCVYCVSRLKCGCLCFQFSFFFVRCPGGHGEWIIKGADVLDLWDLDNHYVLANLLPLTWHDIIPMWDLYRLTTQSPSRSFCSSGQVFLYRKRQCVSVVPSPHFGNIKRSRKSLDLLINTFYTMNCTTHQIT